MAAYAILDGAGKIVHLQLADDDYGTDCIWFEYVGGFWDDLKKEIRRHKELGYTLRSVAVMLE